ncbi:MAG: restriction endonuclease subunit S [Phormidesmis sp. CAN_BIN36]|nr:restriction endonuclease subunit S [Phormidesmis sp. CAN_BIN36]
MLLPDLIFRFRLKSDALVDSCFLHQLLINPAKRREVQKLASGSASSMPNISKAKLQVALIELPPLSLQQEFARRVEAIDRLKATQRQSLAQLDTLFASLQHRAFQGEL